MNQRIIYLTVLVDEYDKAIRFYTEQIGFRVVEDTRLDGGKRWVVVAPRGTGGCGLLLAQAANDEQRSRIGNQTGGRVFLFLHTDDFWRDYHRLLANNVRFVRPPAEAAYGTVAVFEDLYGNQWDLIQPAVAER